ncbi:MAG: tetratricopeptide repeat protein [Candidatus Sumerlaeia bacterium]|nr:tetratricopeptide repeat protein [Candidatus Sumerlaeia bacterium]
MSTATNPYTVLNLRKGATEEEIKQAYFEMVKQWDPERHTDRFMVIQAAYEKLRDAKKRAKEDLFTYNFPRGEFKFLPAEQEGPPQAELQASLRDLLAKVKEGGDGAGAARAEATTLLLTSSFRNFKKKLYREAIADLERVLQIDPTHQRAKVNLNLAYMRLGWSYATNNLIKQAIELWEQSLQMYADNPVIIHNLAIATEADGEREKAERYWAETLRRWKASLDEEPGNEYVKALVIEAHRHFGGRSLDAKREGAPTAIEEYKEVLKINPNDFEAQLKIAETLMQEKKFAEATKELRALSQKNPSNIHVLDLFSWALLNSGEIDAAFTNWQRALQLEPNNLTIKQNMVKARMDLGKKCREAAQYTPALVHFKALLKIFPKSPEVHFELAKTYKDKGDKRSAFQHATMSAQLDPRVKDVKKFLTDLRLAG